MCGASASSAFIVLIGVAALLTSLSLFWLLASVTGDKNLAATGVIVVLCFGAVAGAQGFIGLFLKPGVVFLGLPFLRRYQPAAVFPLFFLFSALCWLALNLEKRSKARLCSALAGLTLAVMVFSYLYLWTATAAWLLCLTLMCVYLRPKDSRQRALELFGIVATLGIVAFIPYAYLLSHRPASLDEAQTLLLTHRPDLFRAPEIMGLFVLLGLIIGVRSGKAVRSDSRVVLAASFALLPLIVFNQQVLTGKSMQPYHFETFVANYAVLVGLVIAINILLPPFPPGLLAWIAVLSFLWGAFEVSMASVANTRSNMTADQIVPVLRRLQKLAKEDGTLTSLHDQGRAATLVFSPQREVMAWLPTWAPQGTLLGMGGLDFGSESQAERKERLYEFLYYSGTDADRLRGLLTDRAGDTYLTHYAQIAIFGHERVVPMLSSNFVPIRAEEVEQEVERFERYANSFSRQNVLLHPLTYIITNEGSDLSRVDRWYDLYTSEKFGTYVLYRVRLRIVPTSPT
jgi:hypothetical protein